MTNLRVLCVQTDLEWDFDDEVQACNDDLHEHIPVAQDGHPLNLAERLADTPQ